jgi:DNA mismatch repair protein MSH5
MNKLSLSSHLIASDPITSHLMAPKHSKRTRKSFRSSKTSNRNHRTPIISSSSPLSQSSRTWPATSLQSRESPESSQNPGSRQPQDQETASALTHDHNADEDETDEHNEIVMAVDVKTPGTVGCCYYAACDEKLFLMEDLKLGGVDAVEACKSPD